MHDSFWDTELLEYREQPRLQVLTPPVPQCILRAANHISGERAEQVFHKAKPCSSTYLCILLPWMHWRVPSSALIVKVSPGLTWTKKTCREKNKQTFVSLWSPKIEISLKQWLCYPFSERGGEAGRTQAGIITPQTAGAGRDLKPTYISGAEMNM